MQFGPIGPGDTNSVSIIEGVGSTAGIFFLPAGVEYGSILNSITQNNQCVYKINSSNCSCSSIAAVHEIQKTVALKIMPNPSTGIFTLQSHNELG